MISFFSRDYFSALPTHPIVCVYLYENSFSHLTTSHLYSGIILVHRFIFFRFFFVDIRSRYYRFFISVQFYVSFFFSAALHNRINTSTFVSKILRGRRENELIFAFMRSSSILFCQPLRDCRVFDEGNFSRANNSAFRNLLEWFCFNPTHLYTKTKMFD